MSTTTHFPVLRDALRHDQPLKRYQPAHDRPPLWSDSTTWADLVATRPAPDLPGLPQGWADDWTLTYRHGPSEYRTTVANASLGSLIVADPIRVNYWHQNRTARPGLRYLHATGRHHAHESLFERKLLLALDFGVVSEVASQPFTLRWHDGDRVRHHTPDFLAVIDNFPIVINVRPAELVNQALLQNAAAIGEACATHGWGHTIVVGYRLPALTTVETVETQANADDRLGYSEQIEDLLLDYGDLQFAQVCDQFPYPLVARSVLQRLVWERRVRIDLNRPLEDWTTVHLVGSEAT